ncbi:MAG: hypothetical protein M0Z43_07190 [Acidithiobacillus sp.]|nr:hypothetical protein [Acidithiobacillus sp.]
MKNWWNNTKDCIEQKGMILVLAFVSLCWAYFAFLVDPFTGGMLLVFEAVVIVAYLAYRFLRLFMR